MLEKLLREKRRGVLSERGRPLSYVGALEAIYGRGLRGRAPWAPWAPAPEEVRGAKGLCCDPGPGGGTPARDIHHSMWSRSAWNANNQIRCAVNIILEVYVQAYRGQHIKRAQRAPKGLLSPGVTVGLQLETRFNIGRGKGDSGWRRETKQIDALQERSSASMPSGAQRGQLLCIFSTTRNG